jgi:Protein of unknown function (DUF3309)
MPVSASSGVTHRSTTTPHGQPPSADTRYTQVPWRRRLGRAVLAMFRGTGSDPQREPQFDTKRVTTALFLSHSCYSPTSLHPGLKGWRSGAETPVSLACFGADATRETAMHQDALHLEQTPKPSPAVRHQNGGVFQATAKVRRLRYGPRPDLGSGKTNHPSHCNLPAARDVCIARPWGLRRNAMSTTRILIIILLLILIGALPTWPYSSGWGYYPSGGLGLIVLIIIILALTGRL